MKSFAVLYDCCKNVYRLWGEDDFSYLLVPYQYDNGKCHVIDDVLAT